MGREGDQEGEEPPCKRIKNDGPSTGVKDGNRSTAGREMDAALLPKNSTGEGPRQEEVKEKGYEPLSTEVGVMEVGVSPQGEREEEEEEASAAAAESKEHPEVVADTREDCKSVESQGSIKVVKCGMLSEAFQVMHCCCCFAGLVVVLLLLLLSCCSCCCPAALVVVLLLLLSCCSCCSAALVVVQRKGNKQAREAAYSTAGELLSHRNMDG